MTQEELQNIDALLNNCRELTVEIDAMKEGEEFLINEYKTNKRWFRDEPGKVITEDIIKTAFAFGWSSHRQFQYNQEIKNERNNK